MSLKCIPSYLYMILNIMCIINSVTPILTKLQFQGFFSQNILSLL